MLREKAVANPFASEKVDLCLCDLDLAGNNSCGWYTQDGFDEAFPMEVEVEHTEANLEDYEYEFENSNPFGDIPFLNHLCQAHLALFFRASRCRPCRR